MQVISKQCAHCIQVGMQQSEPSPPEFYQEQPAGRWEKSAQQAADLDEVSTATDTRPRPLSH
jgi:hypothetical protein